VPVPAEESQAVCEHRRSWIWPFGPSLILALVSFGVFAWITLQRVQHPFELEWMEGGSLQHLIRLLAGEALYPAPSIEFIPFPYPPLYYYAAIPVASVLGVNLLSLRVVSLLATLATALLIHRLVRYETRRWEFGVIGAGLFFATYRASGAYMDVGRLDALFVFWIVGCVATLRIRDDFIGTVLAGVLVSLATLTKQTGIALFFPLAFWCVYRDWTAVVVSGFRYRRSIAFVVTTLGLISFASLLLSHGENSHFFVYMLGTQSGHEIRWSLLPYFFWNDMVVALPLSVVAGVAAIVRSRSAKESADQLGLFFYLAYLAGSVLIWIVPRVKVGGAMNNLIPLHACLVLILGASIGALLKHTSRRRVFESSVAALMLVQFAWLGFDPRIALPKPGDVAAGKRLVEKLASVEGEVLIPANGYLAGLAGKRAFAHQMPVDDLANSGLSEGAVLRDAFSDAIASRRFEMIIDSTSRFLEHFPNDRVLEENYRIAGPVFGHRGDLTPRSGWQIGPGVVWVPREERAQRTRDQ
jgi:hypothetical protein